MQIELVQAGATIMPKIGMISVFMRRSSENIFAVRTAFHSRCCFQTIVSRGQAFHVSPQDFLLVLDAGFLAIVLFWAAVFFAPPLLAGFFAILPAGLPAGFFMITFSRGFMRLRSVTLLFHISLVKSEYGAKRSAASGLCMDIE